MKWKTELLIVVLALGLSVAIFGIGNREVRAQVNCDIDCLNEKVIALSKRVTALESKSNTSKVAMKKAPATTKELFVQIGGGSIAGTDWTRLPGSDFWFDQSLYGNVVKVTWQGWVDNGRAMARLYDETNNRAVDGSEIMVSADRKASFYSAPLAIWRGQNKYSIQIKDINAQVVTVSSPRLSVIVR